MMVDEKHTETVPTTEAPLKKVREDIVISKHEMPEGVRFVVKDPVTDRYFRFGELEGFIVEHLDGKTTKAGLLKLVNEKFQAELDDQTLDQFVARLEACGLIAGPHSVSTPRPAAKRVQGDIFYLRIKLFDPDRFLTKLNSVSGFLFTKTFVFLSAAAILSAFWITLTEWGDITRSFWTMFSSISLTMAWVVILGVVFIHEFSHGLACKRFGGRVNEIGFLLLYFMPAFYCNVSDAWLVPEKSKRIIITLAGAWSETLIWSLATIGWLLLEPNTFIQNASLIIMATSGIKSLFNLNPLIKLDGYYILSDYLEIHNLRWRALSYVGSRIRALWTPDLKPDPTIGARDRRIFMTFGILSAVYTTWLISFFAWDFGVYLLSTYQGVGFIAFSFFLTGILRNPIKKLMRRPLPAVSGVDPPPRKMGMPTKIAIGGAMAFGAMFFIPMELKVSGDFTLLPKHNADIQAEVDGLITKFFVSEGDTVGIGDPIALLADRELVASYEQKKAQTDAAAANLRLVIAGPTRDEIALARAQLEKSQEQLKYAQKELERMNAMFERNLVAGKDLEEKQELAAVRQKEVEEYRSRLNALNAGSRPEHIQARRAEGAQLQSELQYLGDQINALTVRSPIQGIVTTHLLHEKIGQNVKKGDLIVEVHDLESVTAELLIREKEIPNVKVGQTVVLKARAFPTENFTGTVSTIAPVATIPPNWYGGPVVLVRAQLQNDERLLRSGMSGIGKIYCGEQRMVDIVFHKIMYFIRVDVWSWW